MRVPYSRNAGMTVAERRRFTWSRRRVSPPCQPTSAIVSVADNSTTRQTAAVNIYADSQTVPVACPACGQLGHAVFGQSVSNGKLRWYRSIQCPTAGNLEEDGNGFGAAPPDLRRELLAVKGAWSVSATSGEKLKAILTTKRLLSAPFANTTAFLEMFPTLFLGTRAETHWLLAKLAAEGVVGEVAKHSSNNT